MPRLRSTAFLGLCLMLVCVGGMTQTSLAQFGISKDDRLEVKEPTSEQKIKLGEMQRGTLRVKGPDQKANLAVLKANAQFYIYRVTHSDYYDPLSSGDLRPRPENKSVEGLIKELTSTMLFPVNENSSKFTTDQEDFIVEYGAAINEAVRTVLLRNPPLIIRVNATRLLAAAARSGAPAFAKTLDALLNHQFFKTGEKFRPTPPEVYYYALKGAEQLLSSAHPVWHLDPLRPTRHALKDDDLIPFVRTIETIVLKGPTIMETAYAGESPPTTPPTLPMTSPMPPTPPMPPAAALDVKTMTKEQAQVYEFYRRQAVRALAKVRFDTLGSGSPNELRPAFTLAKVAVSDFSIVPAPSTAEIAEATIGLIGLTPSSNLRVDEWAYVIARGTELMIAPKLESEDNQIIPWKLTAARMNTALTNLRKIAPNNPRLRPYQASLVKLCDVITNSILNPIEKEDPSGAVKPSRDQLASWMEQFPPKDPGRSLFDDKPDYRLTSRQSR